MIKIPSAALEAGREAFLECDVNPSYSFDDVIRATFLAMIEAWPGMWPDRFDRVDTICLPIMETRDDD